MNTMYKLMLVEDEATIREGFRVLVREVSRDFEVRWEASHGKDALKVLESDLPDAIITDIRMGEMDGLALSAKVRNIHPELPIIILSGHSDFEYAQQALQTGVLDYLLKPVKRPALIQALGRIRQAIRKSGVPSADVADEAEPAPADGHSLIRKIKAYIRANPDQDLRLQSLADIVHLNPAYLSQLFKSVTEINVSDFVTEARLERARYLLQHTGLKVYDIARLSGYQSPKHFMLVFKEHMHCTPSEFRTRFGIES